MRILPTIALFFCTLLHLSAQTDDYKQKGNQDIDQDRIESLAFAVLQEFPKVEKDSINALLKKELSRSLAKENAFRYSFDRVKSLSILTLPDSAFRIFNWEVSYLDGSNKYECLLLKKLGSESTLEALQPLDSVFEREELENKQLGKSNWLPALYYKIVPVKSRFQTFYTLLAWDGNDLLTNKKYIEVLWFDKSGETHFGAPIFRDNRAVKSRIIFEFGGQNAMNLNFEEELERIFFSHLAPPSSNLEGIYEYYGADITFDAYQWKGNYWQLINEVIPAWADPKGRTETSVSKKTFEKEDVANPNAASKILKESEKMKRVADEKLKEEAEQLKAVPQ
ncbi:hypothetical protein N9502_02035 [Vicingaceae bacterium]|nr:hypothetical protein [Vicingaceae bacterium]MDB4083026.1 hypothetical protein [Vicingaceae bacterium]